MDSPAPVPSGWWWPATAAVLRRPSLWMVAVVQVGRLAAPGWWRRRPFLPVPDPDYLTFRLRTAYGDDRPPDPADVVTYLRWCKDFPDAAQRGEYTRPTTKEGPRWGERSY